MLRGGEAGVLEAPQSIRALRIKFAIDCKKGRALSGPPIQRILILFATIFSFLVAFPSYIFSRRRSILQYASSSTLLFIPSNLSSTHISLSIIIVFQYPMLVSFFEKEAARRPPVGYSSSFVFLSAAFFLLASATSTLSCIWSSLVSETYPRYKQFLVSMITTATLAV